jgi:deoxyhypusine monooxygenase
MSAAPAIVVASDELRSLEDCLCNAAGDVPLHTRFRALFTLKALKSEDAVTIISKGVSRSPCGKEFKRLKKFYSL